MLTSEQAAPQAINRFCQQAYSISNKTGLHARPASVFVQAANKCKCDVRISKDQREIDAKSIISLLSLGAGPGSTITITTCGEDAGEAMTRLVQVLDSFEA